MKKKIIMFHLLNNYSGSPRVLADVISSLKIKYDITLVTSNSTGFLSDVGVDTIFIDYNWNKSTYLTLIKFIKAQVLIVFYSLKHVRKSDLFYINTQQPSVAGLIAKIFRVKVIFHIHETSSSQKYFGKLYKLIRQFVKGNEIFVSKYIYNKEVLDSKKSKIIYNTVSRTISEKSSRIKYNHKIDNIYSVIMICSLREYKGIPEFLSIARIFQNDKTIKFNLLVDGSDNEIKAFFGSKNIPKNLTIIPKTDSPEIFLGESSLLLNLSRVDEWIETFGLTILEAMFFGIPCIVPNIGGPVEIVENGISGYCISSYEIKKIANLINDLKNDVQKSMMMSNESKKRSYLFSRHKFETEIFKFVEKTHG